MGVSLVFKISERESNNHTEVSFELKALGRDTPGRASQRNPGGESPDSPYFESGSLPIDTALPRRLHCIRCWRPDLCRDADSWLGSRQHMPPTRTAGASSDYWRKLLTPDSYYTFDRHRNVAFFLGVEVVFWMHDWATLVKLRYA
ncbi:hypothetical protein NDU88_006037 [Pleurodeles waltl]|uniref:Uncharacterized protein n=1 Tax=Pleurodeles waltl TaxID=8319 RepID=A0AAV7TCT1_PLEWA|nr:hypothetical protein NDU88_006037 [Pleurodeles waltl]